MTANIWYAPEKFGLVQFAEFEYSDGCYQFDTRVVWKDEQGQLWTARDSGCSCPTPFEDYHLGNIDRLTCTDVIREEWKDNFDRCPDMTQDQYQYRIRKIEAYLKEN